LISKMLRVITTTVAVAATPTTCVYPPDIAGSVERSEQRTRC
jgi:hypothetical protein